eukprot:CAMPEP_0184349788 /NCGR_PEP_ID=MMETSP1089-20130417/37164_1 /TAXON_ID=38269 ORGANISM="Gloeochaete wittrockiana, Strain SAG46.84" /NCGR_SAMPLE_ID=MMETSP1089 /ASSEMBLY_ACC=CAM_ASM_000445 /LENGTH=133 /DNA_ID=CAMNT_0026682245 /DNA_START=206 /DNA_END=603 /DNA_ORIENTATION=-
MTLEREGRLGVGEEVESEKVRLGGLEEGAGWSCSEKIKFCTSLGPSGWAGMEDRGGGGGGGPFLALRDSVLSVETGGGSEGGCWEMDGVRVAWDKVGVAAGGREGMLGGDADWVGLCEDADVGVDGLEVVAEG